MKQHNEIDIYEIAEKCGVSIATVSRVINGKDNVKESTREMIKETIASLGYVPSDVARGLSTQKTSLIGVAIPGINNYFGDKLESLFQTSRSLGYTVLIGGNIRTSNDDQAELEQLESFVERRVEGLIVFVSKSSDTLRNRLKEISKRIPVIVFGQDLFHAGLSCVIRNDGAGMQNMIDYLVSMGHRRIVHIRGPLYDPVAGMRARAFAEDIKRRKLPFDDNDIFQGYFSLGSGYRAGMEICQRIKTGSLNCTAVLCGNDNMAIGMMRAASEAGLRVPEDLSITGMDDLEISSYLTPPLTTMKEDNAAIGRALAEQIHSHIMQKEYTPQRLIFDQELVIRNSVAKNKES